MNVRLLVALQGWTAVGLVMLGLAGPAHAIEPITQTNGSCASGQCAGGECESAPDAAYYDDWEDHPCPKHHCIYGSAEALLWWVKGAPVPPLVSTGPVVSLAPGQRPGAIGLPGTQLLIHDVIDFGPAPGGRFFAGVWLDKGESLALEAGFFFLGDRANVHSIHSSGQPGSPALSIPFFDARLNRESSTGIALPGAFAGAIDITTTTRLLGSEANIVLACCNRDGVRLDLIGGFRHVGLDESVQIATTSPSIVGPRDFFSTLDDFRTENDFYGAQFGFRLESCQYKCVFWSFTGKVALGGIRQKTGIAGGLATNDFNGFRGVQQFPGGYFAQPTNIGQFDHGDFAFVPEGTFQVGLMPKEWLRLTAGYNFLYFSNVARPGDQIERGINTSQAPAITGVPSTTLVGPRRPAYPVGNGDFWAHGVSAGMEFRY